MHNKVIVIGGGLGGLSAAIRLTRIGFPVELYEKNRSLGGKMNEVRLNGYRFDTGPSLLTMASTIDDLLEFAGFKREEYLELIKLESVCRYFYRDGTILNASSDIQTMKDEIRRIAASDESKYVPFLEYSRDIYEQTADIFLNQPIHEIRKIFTWDIMKKLVQIHKIDPCRTVHQGVTRFFDDSRLVQLFDRYATYNGSNPYKAPATLNIIPYVEMVLGGYYIKGGMYQLVKTFETIARELGVKFFIGKEVTKIVTKDRKIQGIEIVGEFAPARYVISNADAVETYRTLLPGSSKRRKLKGLEPSLSGMVFMWGINRKHATLAHHNIFFSNNYKKEFDQIFGEQLPPEDPTVYIAITGKTDPRHAPAGAENWFVLLNMPYITGKSDWQQVVDEMRLAIFQKIERFDIDIQGAIETESVLTPEDFQLMYGANKGSIYGISSNTRSAAFNRPANRNREFDGLYFAGGSVHPGGGIPLVLQSGKMVAELIADRDGITLDSDIKPFLVSSSSQRKIDGTNE